jgi:hypothetical protein
LIPPLWVVGATLSNHTGLGNAVIIPTDINNLIIRSSEDQAFSFYRGGKSLRLVSAAGTAAGHKIYPRLDDLANQSCPQWNPAPRCWSLGF